MLYAIDMNSMQDCKFLCLRLWTKLSKGLKKVTKSSLFCFHFIILILLGPYTFWSVVLLMCFVFIYTLQKCKSIEKKDLSWIAVWLLWYVREQIYSTNCPEMAWCTYMLLLSCFPGFCAWHPSIAVTLQTFGHSHISDECLFGFGILTIVWWE